MKCPKCGRIIEDHSVFCEYCGHKIKKAMWPWLILVGAVLIGVIVAVVIANNNKQLSVSREEEALYHNCQTAADYRYYLSVYPDGQFAAMARNKVEEMVHDSIQLQLDVRAAERNAYENCITQRDCRNYLEKYPRGQYTNQIVQKLNRLQQDSLNEIRMRKEEEQNAKTNERSSSQNGNGNSRYVNTNQSYSSASVKYVVIDGTQLRLRMGPSTSADTFKWRDGTNRHPAVGSKYKYLGESGDFYKIDFNGHQLWVSKEFSHIERY